MFKVTQKIKEKTDRDPEMFYEAPMLFIALVTVTAGINTMPENIVLGVSLIAFSAVLVVLEKYIEKKNK